MNSIELQSYVKNIVEDSNFGIEMYSLLHTDDGLFELKKFQINDVLHNEVKKKLFEVLDLEILSEDFSLMSVENIDEKIKTYYEIPQSKNYKPFDFLNVVCENLEKYKEKEQPKLKGFCIKINRNDNFFWIYQHKYPTTLINRNTSIFAKLNGSVYEPLDCDVVRLESKIDILIIDNYLVTKNINLLQNMFGFDGYVRSIALKVIESIKNIDIIVDMSKLISLANGQKLTIAKKLMKASKSPVLQIPKIQLHNKLKKHDYYSKHIKIDDKSNKIIISSQNDVKEFLKMINDEILKSELTGNNYESSAKEKLNNQNNKNKI